jgi:hypothetical protein
MELTRLNGIYYPDSVVRTSACIKKWHKRSSITNGKERVMQKHLKIKMEI